jgi:integrase
MELHSKQNKRSWKRDEMSLKKLNPYFKGMTLQEMKPDLIERYKAKRKADISLRKTKTSESTINREIALLKTIFNKAIEWGRIEKNPLDKIKKFKENHQKDMRVLKDEEAILLIDSAVSHLKPILILALNTGMRRGEIFSLKWENIDFKKGEIFIEDSKSGKSRKVYMNSIIFETLKEMPKDSKYLFPNKKTGSHIKDVKNSFKTACKIANIKGFRFHDTRHTAATKMIEAGVDIVTLSRILGHSSIQMTMRYSHPGEKTMREAAEKLGKIYNQTRQKVDTSIETVIIRKPVKHLYEYN